MRDVGPRGSDFRKITHDWMKQSRESLQRHVDTATERAVRHLLSLHTTPGTSGQISEKNPQ